MPQRSTNSPGADGPISGHIGAESAHRPEPSTNRRIAMLAGRQHGVVSLEQLMALGLAENAVRKRVKRGQLCRVFVGAYAVGHRPLTREARFIAAVLACGDGAVLSHRSAAVLHGLCDERRGEPNHVTASNRRGRSPAGIVAHRDGSLAAVDRGVVKRIPCTTVSRTLLDLAATVSVGELRSAVGQAAQLRKLDRSRLRKLIRRHRGRRGVARLRLVLDGTHRQSEKTRSELERAFLRLCDRAALPEPAVNALVEVEDGLFEADFLWSSQRLVVEADSRRFHDTDTAFQSDRKRDQELQVAGWRVARCTWEQVETEPRQLAARVRALLARL